MAVDGFNELFNVIYIAKKLHDMGKYELVKESFCDTLHLDFYYENMYGLIDNLFSYSDTRYSENRYCDLHILSDKVIEDFYILAGKYGKRNNIPESENPYIEAAVDEAYNNLNFSYCLDWKLMGHTNPQRPYHSRIGLFISHEGYIDLGVLAYRLIELYEWFENKCVELSSILADDPNQLKFEEVAMAA